MISRRASRPPGSAFWSEGKSVGGVGKNSLRAASPYEAQMASISAVVAPGRRTPTPGV